MKALPVLFLLLLFVQNLKQILDMRVWEVNGLMVIKSFGKYVIDQLQSQFSSIFNVVVRQQQPD